MSSFFFKTDINSIAETGALKERLDQARDNHDIDNWRIHPTDPQHVLEIETTKLSSNEVEHLVRAAGIEAEFTNAPQAR